MKALTRFALAALASTAALVPAVSDAAPLAVHVIDGDGKPLADAVVVVFVQGTKTTAAPGTTAQLGQRDRQFLPQVTVVQTGTGVLFPNFDTVRHHVYSFSSIQKFELKLYAGTPTAPVVFDQPGMAVLGCNIHDRMKAWVHVVDSPYFAKTDAAGDVALDVPAGDHAMRLWHPGLGDDAMPVDEPIRVAAAGTRKTIRLPIPPAP